MFDIIKNGIGFVTMKFADGSVKVIRTTLNKNILAEKGIRLKTNTFFDLDKFTYVPFRSDVIDITITQDKPNFDSEVANFVNQFI